MVEINIKAWADWDQCIKYIEAMCNKGFNVKLINTSSLFNLWYKKDLKQLGFIK